MVFLRSQRGTRSFALLPVLVAALWAYPSLLRAQANEACAACHDQAQKIQASAHAAVGCSTCHPKHEAYPHAQGVAKPVCAQCHASQAGEHARSVHGLALKRGNTDAPDCVMCHGSAHELTPARTDAFRSHVPETCGMCHDDISKQFLSSVHGKAIARGIMQAPVCTDCHGEHAIQAPSNRASLVNPQNIRETCGRCHGNVRLTNKFGMPSDRVVSFDASYHGLEAAAGSQTVANCASCHGVHNILPSSEAASTINPKNLAATCGKCHTGASNRLALGPVHLWPGRVEPASVAMVRRAYFVLIPVTIGLMLLHNLGDWVRKLRAVRSKTYYKPPKPFHPGYGPMRMLRFERIQHALLLLSFIVLAWTGFQLKYPDQWWAKSVLSWEARWSLRGAIHRGAAVVFIATALMHLISLIVDRKLREHWKNMLPRYTDAADAWQSFAYNVGLSPRKPHLPPYSFMEKAEYWALIWGGVVMGVSGLLLWANNLALRWLPKEVLDCATALHFYEAVLACLAIVVWHWYIVIFDPDVYPLDTAFLNGRGVREHAEPEPKHERVAGRW